jgi:hypothetical protein
MITVITVSVMPVGIVTVMMMIPVTIFGTAGQQRGTERNNRDDFEHIFHLTPPVFIHMGCAFGFIQPVRRF